MQAQGKRVRARFPENVAAKTKVAGTKANTAKSTVNSVR